MRIGNDRLTAPIFLAAVIVNAVFAVCYLIYGLVTARRGGRERGNRGKYVLLSFVMLICPVAAACTLGAGHLVYQLFIDIPAKSIPGVPAHGGFKCYNRHDLSVILSKICTQPQHMVSDTGTVDIARCHAFIDRKSSSDSCCLT